MYFVKIEKDKMNLFKRAIINSFGTTVYIAIVSLVMSNGNRIFGQGDNIFTGVGILLLFTLSALVVGSLVLAKPIMLYIDGSKKESVKLLTQEISILAVFTIIYLVILALNK